VIDNVRCAEHPRKMTLAAVTIETGETVGMCLECYSKWCEAQRKAVNYSLSMEEHLLLAQGEAATDAQSD
jgi:hypothetical protein